MPNLVSARWIHRSICDTYCTVTYICLYSNIILYLIYHTELIYLPSFGVRNLNIVYVSNWKRSIVKEGWIERVITERFQNSLEIARRRKLQMATDRVFRWFSDARQTLKITDEIFGDVFCFEEDHLMVLTRDEDLGNSESSTIELFHVSNRVNH